MPLRRLHSNARTVAIIRYLRAAGGTLRRRGPMPRQQQPDAIRREYYRAIEREVCEPARRAFERVGPEILRLLADHRAGQRQDAAQDDHAKMLVTMAAERMVREMRPNELHDIARKFGKRTSDFQREQLDRQVRHAMAVPLASVERPITDKLDGFARENVELIRTVPERYFDSLRQRVREAFEGGMHPEELAKEFEQRYEVSLSDARRIARDQIGKINGQLNMERQVAMGVTSYLWRSARDNRVRDEHSDRDGKMFRWDDPPEDGHPGEPIQCRCFSEPDFSQILQGAAEPDPSPASLSLVES